MSFRNQSTLLAALAAAMTLLPAYSALRAEETPAATAAPTAEWPCISRKVLELSPAQIWDGPSLEGTEKWRDDEDIRKLSQYIIARRVPVADAEAAIKKFADATPEAERDKRLTLLFAGVLSRVNDERKIVMNGIERFHVRQKARAAAIEQQGIALPDQGAALPENPMPASEIDHVSEEEAKWRWEVRVFQERQQNIPIACEIPQLIEERAGEVARAIRAQMKS